MRRNYLNCIVGVAACGLAIHSASRLTVQQIPTRPSEATRSPTTLLVQEPAERSSRRPDFSNLLRQSSGRGNFHTLRAFRDATGNAWRSTVRIMDGDDQVAFGAIVHGDGYVVTKASQLPIGRTLVCELFDERRSKIEPVAISDEHDLAILRIGYKGLAPVDWEMPFAPQRGNWLATSSLNPTPVAVGIVSAGYQSVPKKRPILGVSLEDSTMGTSIKEVVHGSGGDIAGLQVGDVITSINGKDLSSTNAIIEEIKSCKAGQTIQIGIVRGRKASEIAARVMDLAEELWDPTELEVNGSISHRSTGYSKVFLHDTVLLPNQCGGPLVNLNGKVVGINIARAGRVTSYAIPADVVSSLVTNHLKNTKSSVVPAGATKSSARISEVR